MKIPAIQGIIRRRVLLNYRIDPDVAREMLPKQSPFQLKLVNGYAIAGICLIRLEKIRPKGLPGLLGISSENSAHRIAVEWETDNGEACEGVFVPRRDTDSLLNSLAGGRVFPGVHHHSEFSVKDGDSEVSMRVTAKDFENPLVAFEASEAEVFPESSVFNSLEESSEFFEAGCIGYSSRPNSCKLDGLTLKTLQWRVCSLTVSNLASAYFDDRSIYPADSIEFDHALLMRDIPHEWHSEPQIEVRI